MDLSGKPITGLIRSRSEDTSAIGQVVDGRPEGFFKTFYSNGQVETEGKIHNGKQHGLIKTYSEDGRHINETEYSNGVLHGVVRDYEDGVLVSE